MLTALERIKQDRGESAVGRKLALLERLSEHALVNPNQVRRLHEALCFLRAYPDDPRVLQRVESMLAGFAQRPDLRACGEALCNSGIAGTPIRTSFYFATVRWLVLCWPSYVHVDWPEFEHADRLEALLPLLMPAPDGLAVDESGLTAKALIELLKGPQETDAAFIVRRFEALECADPLRHKLFDEMELPMVLSPGPGTPSRTASRLPGAGVFYVSRAAGADRDWRRMKPLAARALSAAKGEKVVSLGRTQMITRNRDLYAFMNGNPRDVTLFEMGDGLQFAAIGLVPEARFQIETLYVYLAFQSGVPVGYMQASALLRSAEINFNVFDSFRGAQAAHVLRSFLAMVRHSLGCDAFIINTQQLGAGNAEALKTGAFWFYHKFGFRPRNPEVERIMNREVAARARDPSHRSSLGTLRKLAADYLFLFTGRTRARTVSTIEVDRVGLRVSRYLARRFGADREAGLAICAREAAHALGLRRLPAGSDAQRAAWRNWAPLVLLAGCERWSDDDKQEMVEIVRAKGGRRESDYLLRFDRHALLRRTLLRMMS